MSGTMQPRQMRRAQSWLDQNQDLGPVTVEACDLLARRLAARYRAVLGLIPFVAVTVALFASAFLGDAQQGTLGGEKSYAARVLAAYAVLAVGAVVMARLTARAERSIGESLTHRVSRGTAVSYRLMFGPARTASVTVGLLLEAGLAMTLLTVRAGWFGWAFLVAVIGAAGIVGIGVRQAATRPTLAVDPVSLTIDERFRSQEAFSASMPVFWLMLVFPGGDSTRIPSWLQLTWFIAVIVVAALFVWGSLRAPWGWVLTGRGHFVVPNGSATRT